MMNFIKSLFMMLFAIMMASAAVVCEQQVTFTTTLEGESKLLSNNSCSQEHD